MNKFWEEKSLSEMSKSEWEAVCDGCAKCCLHKFVHEVEEDNDRDSSVNLHESRDINSDADEGDAARGTVNTTHPHEPALYLKEGEKVEFTNIACRLLNTKTCSCMQYDKRTSLVPDCVKLSKNNISEVFFMPPSCSYRRLHEGRGLASWHPLLNKHKKSKMHLAGMSVRGKIESERDLYELDYEQHIVVWPLDDVD